MVVLIIFAVILQRVVNFRMPYIVRPGLQSSDRQMQISKRVYISAQNFSFPDKWVVSQVR